MFVPSEEFKDLETLNPRFGTGEEINHILRGELSAVEAYREAMDAFQDNVILKKQLKELWSDHLNAVDFWKNQVVKEGVAAENSSGVWGTVVSSVIGTAELLGEKVTLKALKSGEKHGLNEYKGLLESPQLSRSQKRQVREYFIPQQQRHMAKIETMLSSHS